ncbi:membrane bound O-acyl transferase family-domain-containing protein [Multifurca ochricompacta]|uniref:Membrane bound O-acyl transferase family-domain-containing protein n=1 Tax=Multifurca ochricompacta TaxID=376703 RepID=A0AAD4QQ67_9AGAM|nr:membrane bound O-acyl transferase family-domain-containing protein [Multifurca ochricompacta]
MKHHILLSISISISIIMSRSNTTVTLYQELAWGSAKAFRTFVPPPQDRIPITWHTAPYMLVQFIPYSFMSYLVQRPDTHLIRLLFLPTLIITALHSSYGYVWLDPRYNVFNWAAALFSFVLIGKGIDLALARTGRHKRGEAAQGTMSTPASTAKNEPDTTGSSSSSKRHCATLLPLWLRDALELIFSMRGLGWDFGEGIYTPPPNRPQDRKPFLHATLNSFLVNFLILDIVEAAIKLIPGVGDPFGGSIFFPGLPPPTRYVVSTVIHVLTGVALVAGFGMVYDLITLFAVAVLGHSPKSWPPIMDNPWAAQSLHEFWAKRWHQLLRQTFLVFGGIPGRKIAGDFGLVLGTFLASGLFHECTILAMGREWDSRVPLFFLLQGGSLIGERIWRKVTGRRVGGFLGRLWVYFDIVILGQPLVDAWHKRGLGGGMVIPPKMSPARLLLTSAIRRLMA